MEDSDLERCFDEKCEKKKLEAIFEKHDKSTNFFSLNGTKCWGRVVDVYDGDTIKIVIPIRVGGGIFFKFSARLYGIDTGELKSEKEEIKRLGLMAKERLTELIGGRRNGVLTNESLVWVECLEWDKYGRLLIKIYKNPGEESLGDILIKEKLAYEYDGGKKKTDTEIEQELIKKK